MAYFAIQVYLDRLAELLADVQLDPWGPACVELNALVKGQVTWTLVLCLLHPWLQ